MLHRIADLNELPVSRLAPLMRLLVAYDGAVAMAARLDSSAEEAPDLMRDPAEYALPGTAETLLTNPQFGPAPGAGQMVGLFEGSTVLAS